ncbi:MAG: AI-2E family transporter [Burkholderiaceae bacterium]
MPSILLSGRGIAEPAVAAAAVATRSNYLTTGATASVVLAALYFGRDVLIPLALAALLAFALAPLANRLRRIGLGRAGSVGVVVVLALSLAAGSGVLIGRQVMKLADNLSVYKGNIENKIRVFRSTVAGGGTLDKASTAIRELSEEINKPGDAVQGSARPNGRPKPAEAPLVRVQAADPSPLAVARNVLLPLLEPIATLGLIIVFLVFMLLEKEELRDRMIRLFGDRDMSMTTQAMTEAASRVSRYLLMQLMVNLTYGIPVGLGLYLIGVPNALLWGALAVVLRFVPYAGSALAMMFPIALAIAVDPGWTMVGWTLALFLVLELISNNVVEPMLYGASTGMTAVAVIVAAIFWTALWGPAGLLLSTPLTVCLVVLGRYVPQLRFLYVLLGSTPALTPAERFYQRMLASDLLEGTEIARQFALESGIREFHQHVALSALQLAEVDRRRNVLSADGAHGVGVIVQRVVAQLDDFDDERAPSDPDAPQESAVPEVPAMMWGEGAVLCVGARTSLDAAAATLLAQQLALDGIGARVGPDGPPTGSELRALLAPRQQRNELVVLVALGHDAAVQAPHACRRLRKYTDTPILLLLLDGSADPDSGVVADANPDKHGAKRSGTAAYSVVTSFEEALAWIAERARAPITSPMVAPPVPEREAERLQAVHATGLLDTPPEDVFDEITRDLKEQLQVPIALISLVDARRQFWKSSAGLPPEMRQAREAPRNTSICGHLVAANEMMVVEDVTRDPRFANNPFLRERGIRFYAGVPLRARNGLAIGSVCVMDQRPRRLGNDEKALLQVAAQQAMWEIATRGSAGQAQPVLIPLPA